jgi:hypothetical protein
VKAQLILEKKNRIGFFGRNPKSDSRLLPSQLKSRKKRPFFLDFLKNPVDLGMKTWYCVDALEIDFSIHCTK